MRKRSYSLVVGLWLVLGSAGIVPASDDQAVVSICSLPKSVQVYVIPWEEWEKIKEEAFIPTYPLDPTVEVVELPNTEILGYRAVKILYYLPFSEQRVAVVGSTRTGKLVFVWPGVIYWKNHSKTQVDWLKKRLFARYMWGRTPIEETARQGDYAILLVRDLSGKQLHYQFAPQPLLASYPDWENSLLPSTNLEYGVSVTGFDPIVYQFFALYRVTIKGQLHQRFYFVCGGGTLTTEDGKIHFVSDETVDVWLPYLESQNPSDREAAAHALGRLAKTGLDKGKALPALIKALRDKVVEVRWNAIQSLRHIGDESIIKPLKEALSQEKDEEVKKAMKDALEKLQAK